MLRACPGGRMFELRPLASGSLFLKTVMHSWWLWLYGQDLGLTAIPFLPPSSPCAVYLSPLHWGWECLEASVQTLHALPPGSSCFECIGFQDTVIRALAWFFCSRSFVVGSAWTVTNPSQPSPCWSFEKIRSWFWWLFYMQTSGKPNLFLELITSPCVCIFMLNFPVFRKCTTLLKKRINSFL